MLIHSMKNRKVNVILRLNSKIANSIYKGKNILALLTIVLLRLRSSLTKKYIFQKICS